MHNSDVISFSAKNDTLIVDRLSSGGSCSKRGQPAPLRFQLNSNPGRGALTETESSASLSSLFVRSKNGPRKFCGSTGVQGVP